MKKEEGIRAKEKIYKSQAMLEYYKNEVFIYPYYYGIIMWVAKLKLKHEDCVIGRRCKRFHITSIGVPFNSYKEGDKEYFSHFETLIGDNDKMLYMLIKTIKTFIYSPQTWKLNKNNKEVLLSKANFLNSLKNLLGIMIYSENENLKDYIEKLIFERIPFISSCKKLKFKKLYDDEILNAIISDYI